MRSPIVLCVGLFAAMLCFGGEPASGSKKLAQTGTPEKPAGTVYGNGPVRVRGVELQAGTAWPVFAGDRVQTGAATAVLKLRDGMLTWIPENSAIVVGGNVQRAPSHLRSGYTCKARVPWARCDLCDLPNPPADICWRHR